jgi:hypothetical protein
MKQILDEITALLIDVLKGKAITFTFSTEGIEFDPSMAYRAFKITNARHLFAFHSKTPKRRMLSRTSSMI